MSAIIDPIGPECFGGTDYPEPDYYQIAKDTQRPSARSRIFCVYVAGPYTAPDALAVERNIRRAESFAYEVARLRAMPVCPHTNLRYTSSDLVEFLYPATLELMRRCDAVIFVPGWEQSKGSIAEREEAIRIGLPCFDSLSDLAVWLDNGSVRTSL